MSLTADTKFETGDVVRLKAQHKRPTVDAETGEELQEPEQFTVYSHNEPKRLKLHWTDSEGRVRHRTAFYPDMYELV